MNPITESINQYLQPKVVWIMNDCYQVCGSIEAIMRVYQDYFIEELRNDISTTISKSTLISSIKCSWVDISTIETLEQLLSNLRQHLQALPSGKLTVIEITFNNHVSVRDKIVKKKLIF